MILDTHVWVWWVSEPTRLSDRASGAIQGAIASNSIVISSISAWEITMLVEAGRLVLDRDVRDWIAASEQLPFVRFVPVDNSIAVSSVRLPGLLHKDPADRIIAATALATGVPLITADRKLRRYEHLTTIW